MLFSFWVNYVLSHTPEFYVCKNLQPEDIIFYFFFRNTKTNFHALPSAWEHPHGRPTWRSDQNLWLRQCSGDHTWWGSILQIWHTWICCTRNRQSDPCVKSNRYLVSLTFTTKYYVLRFFFCPDIVNTPLSSNIHLSFPRSIGVIAYLWWVKFSL